MVNTFFPHIKKAQSQTFVFRDLKSSLQRMTAKSCRKKLARFHSSSVQQRSKQGWRTFSRRRLGRSRRGRPVARVDHAIFYKINYSFHALFIPHILSHSRKCRNNLSAIAMTSVDNHEICICSLSSTTRIYT